jgi:hypothetical protein
MEESEEEVVRLIFKIRKVYGGFGGEIVNQTEVHICLQPKA